MSDLMFDGLFIQSSKPKWKKRYRMLIQQDLLVSELKEIMTTINSSKEDRLKRVS